jgi:hypothetical protein
MNAGVVARERPGWLDSTPLVRVCVAASVWGVAYGAYRGYYALGGTLGMVGAYSSPAVWRSINAAGAAALLVAAAVPVAALWLSRRRVARAVLLVLFSIAAVGLVMHALIDEVQRLLSLTGLAARWHLSLPATSTAGWLWKDQHASDLQDVLLNEPWFLVEGLLCATVVWLALGPGTTRRRWLAGSLVAVAACVAFGLLTALGVVPRAIVL